MTTSSDGMRCTLHNGEVWSATGQCAGAHSFTRHKQKQDSDGCTDVRVYLFHHQWIHTDGSHSVDASLGGLLRSYGRAAALCWKRSSCELLAGVLLPLNRSPRRSLNRFIFSSCSQFVLSLSNAVLGTVSELINHVPYFTNCWDLSMVLTAQLGLCRC
jgi:hypothetical protein